MLKILIRLKKFLRALGRLVKMLLNGKTALVTGASRGIGRAIALALAGVGADVAINFAYRTEEAEEVAEEIKKMGRNSFACRANVADQAQTVEMVGLVQKKMGKIDILVNNAGITRDNLVMLMREKDWDDVILTNLKGAFNCTRAVARFMLKSKWGRIINISSVVGINGNAGQANYAASKGGLIAFTKSVARELGSRNITVNAVAPGFIMTEMTEDLPEAAKEKILSQIVLGRLGKPAEVAQAVVFLASDAAGYITGQVIMVDGGMAM